MSTFVLVHGSWHGGWCWHKIVARLERAGHRALAPDCPATAATAGRLPASASLTMCAA